MTLQDDLIRDEGLRLTPYLDTSKKLTIGVGRNLTDVGITEDEAVTLLQNDIARVTGDLERTFSWYNAAPQPVKDGLANICFNCGLGGLLGFQNMLKALAAQDYATAATEALNSQWAVQVGDRAKRIAAMFRGDGIGGTDT